MAQSMGCSFAELVFHFVGRNSKEINGQLQTALSLYIILLQQIYDLYVYKILFLYTWSFMT